MSINKLFHKDSHRSLIKSTSILSLGTLSSRILGLVRDVIVAKLLGTGFRADAFFVASKIPNLFRDLVGEGAVSAAVVPVLSEYKEKEDIKTFWEFANALFAWALIVLSVITILGIISGTGDRSGDRARVHGGPGKTCLDRQPDPVHVPVSGLYRVDRLQHGDPVRIPFFLGPGIQSMSS